jgi:hypothetical protein
MTIITWHHPLMGYIWNLIFDESPWEIYPTQYRNTTHIDHVLVHEAYLIIASIPWDHLIPLGTTSTFCVLISWIYSLHFILINLVSILFLYYNDVLNINMNAHSILFSKTYLPIVRFENKNKIPTQTAKIYYPWRCNLLAFHHPGHHTNGESG